MNTLAFHENTDYGVVTNSFGRKCLSRMEVANRDSLYSFHVNTEPPTYCSSTFMLSSTVHRSPLAITKLFYNSAACIKKFEVTVELTACKTVTEKLFMLYLHRRHV